MEGGKWQVIVAQCIFGAEIDCPLLIAWTIDAQSQIAHYIALLGPTEESVILRIRNW